MNHSSNNDQRPAAAAASTAQPAATWVRAKRAPRRKRTDGASLLQLGAIDLASNRHA